MTALRLLRRGGVVEIDERLAVDLLLQDREVARGPSDVEAARTGRRARVMDASWPHESRALRS